MKNLLISIGLCLVFAGCAHTSGALKPLTEPEFGMTKQQMLESLGKPDRIEIYQAKGQDQTRKEFYIYIRQYGSSSYELPICLIKDKVVGWGKAYYRDHVRSYDIRIK
ncbi:MAG: hypothetical protein KGJ09_04140 [Candidatus Omnitrophica bacterium]|nr:hypothetical protein [Candidatus Omnitrophota bacterium]MDE2009251.1 hypothetical protein [Candidatus Omnitrophota bacterium]MDE2213771.1 hypothetical protein [Candidatus Omnitrophota bacterium]MDE2230653.1 hypothetical protein [Candidatus Omnitrophota bacterium]